MRNDMEQIEDKKELEILELYLEELKALPRIELEEKEMLFKDLKEYIKHVYYLIENPKEYSKIKKQARVSADVHSSKYFAERVLDVYKIAIETNNGNKDILVGTIEEVIKRGLHGK